MQIESATTLEKLQPRPVRMWARALAGVIVTLGIPATGLALSELEALHGRTRC
jgi:hypothetical protein